MDEITLLEALHQMCHHKSKRNHITFEVTFDDGITRKAYFSKYWSHITKSWQYIVQDGQNAPGFCYDERAAVSAILGISGMQLYGCTVKYHIELRK